MIKEIVKHYVEFYMIYDKNNEKEQLRKELYTYQHGRIKYLSSQIEYLRGQNRRNGFQFIIFVVVIILFICFLGYAINIDGVNQVFLDQLKDYLCVILFPFIIAYLEFASSKETSINSDTGSKEKEIFDLCLELKKNDKLSKEEELLLNQYSSKAEKEVSKFMKFINKFSIKR